MQIVAELWHLTFFEKACPAVGRFELLSENISVGVSCCTYMYIWPTPLYLLIYYGFSASPSGGIILPNFTSVQ